MAITLEARHSSVTREPLEIGRFLDQLERRIHFLSDIAENVCRRAQSPGTEVLRFTEYTRCRDRASECWAFAIIIDRRLQDYDGLDRGKLLERFNRLSVDIWAILLRASLTFLTALSNEPHLPLGSRDIFLREIRTLHDTHRLLSKPRYAKLLDETAHKSRKKAAKILSEIIARAPSLLDFGT
ncbi:hypothetical protein HEQ60_08590 [Haematospirillum sp. H1815]|uniref:hypothetical protein n=1 Tax=Haematospirillum sp. H1815 TaxID=2723108 RepID=UPI00143B35AA|nr:hypothetical protein [Haematospirillum sp. H1815]NKD77816.1 hypothetical protein [Haematospirillum sp. H1815]